MLLCIAEFDQHSQFAVLVATSASHVAGVVMCDSNIIVMEECALLLSLRTLLLTQNQPKPRHTGFTVLGLCVCLSVCLLTPILALQATRQFF